eukprot:GHVS01069783.1.p1 GENE.GHVS01069783.1~~GHVS01069783.1.p1  ORF type:complete len:296 (+),score=94.82 GHVS01069783.1:104-889(+)
MAADTSPAYVATTDATVEQEATVAEEVAEEVERLATVLIETGRYDLDKAEDVDLLMSHVRYIISLANAPEKIRRLLHQQTANSNNNLTTETNPQQQQRTSSYMRRLETATPPPPPLASAAATVATTASGATTSPVAVVALPLSVLSTVDESLQQALYNSNGVMKDVQGAVHTVFPFIRPAAIHGYRRKSPAKATAGTPTSAYARPLLLKTAFENVDGLRKDVLQLPLVPPTFPTATRLPTLGAVARRPSELIKPIVEALGN